MMNRNDTPPDPPAYKSVQQAGNLQGNPNRDTIAASPISEAMSVLDGQLDLLRDSILQLTARLAPIIGPHPASPTKPGAATPGMSQIDAHLRRMISSVQEQREHVNELIDSLAL